jgi:hypothetical protein
MSKLLITTQVYENYGAHDWDGTGVCPEYWKAKGGSDYVVLNIDINSAKEIAQAVRGQCECDNQGYRESIIAWEVVADDYLTEFEQMQLDYEGKIRFKAKELVLETVDH